MGGRSSKRLFKRYAWRGHWYGAKEKPDKTYWTAKVGGKPSCIVPCTKAEGRHLGNAKRMKNTQRSAREFRTNEVYRQFSQLLDVKEYKF